MGANPEVRRLAVPARKRLCLMKVLRSLPFFMSAALLSRTLLAKRPPIWLNGCVFLFHQKPAQRSDIFQRLQILDGFYGAPSRVLVQNLARARGKFSSA